ncbi:MAG TPA: hypothetical protein VIV60_16330, partial [Polyangiaceae bacterium]
MLGKDVQSRRPIRKPHGLHLALVAVASIDLAPLPGAAQTAATDQLQLLWTAPNECPTTAQIRNDVQSLLARTTAVPREVLAVKASIQQTANGRYTLHLLANGQTRRLDGASCTKVAEAAALLIALLLDPSLSSSDAEKRDAAAPELRASANAESTASASTAANAHPAQTQRSRAEPTSKDPALVAVPTDKASPIAALVELATRLDIGSWPGLEPAVIAGL